MPKNLLIVESPAKAKTIERYLGEDFVVKASYGHIRDLPKGNEAIDIENGFEPVYVVPSDKQQVVSELKKLAGKVEQVWLATDEDREGEAISWHLAQELGLDLETTRRIVFHEITKKAIQNAIQNPRTIDSNLVNAQQARRVLDRLVGFELSPVLWKKVKFGLSAGRVQSVAVRLIVEREREIINFQTADFYRVQGDFLSAQQKPFNAELSKRLENEQAAQSFLQACNGAAFQIKSVEKKPGKRSPAPPFTTSTLQQEASTRLGYAVATTMRLAQNLYEAGHITYMRTDSLNLSQDALNAAEQVIKNDFGDRYHKLRTYKSKSASAQEAHEAIRPTNLAARQVASDARQQKLYELIWKRTLACQMADAELERTTVHIQVQPPQPPPQPLPDFVAKGEIITFDGFLKLYLDAPAEDEEEQTLSGLLPPLKQDDYVAAQRITATQRFTRPPARYTEARLVKDLEELGIGRPSTYAPTISTIQKREYVVKDTREGKPRDYVVLKLEQDKVDRQVKSETSGNEKNKLFPTDLGMLVTDFLVTYFPDIVDYSFTAKVEEDFDRIAQGDEQWREMLDIFYRDFHPKVQKTEETAQRVVGERVLGVDPKTGKQVIARLGRYGPLVQLGEQDDPEKRFANLKADQHLETITLEEALVLFKLPRVLGKYEDEIVKANIGRFGPYLLHRDKFTSIPQELDPYTIELEQAIEVIEAKRKADREKIIQTFPDSGEAEAQILRGRWGPYLVYNGYNVKIPKDTDPEALTLEECKALYEEAEAAGKLKGKGKKKTAAKGKAAAKSTRAKNEPKAAPAQKSPSRGKTTKSTTAKSSSSKSSSAKSSSSESGSGKSGSAKSSTAKKTIGKKSGAKTSPKSSKKDES